MKTKRAGERPLLVYLDNEFTGCYGNQKAPQQVRDAVLFDSSAVGIYLQQQESASPAGFSNPGLMAET
jgi:hypothetical protein